MDWKSIIGPWRADTASKPTDLAVTDKDHLVLEWFHQFFCLQPPFTQATCQLWANTIINSLCRQRRDDWWQLIKFILPDWKSFFTFHQHQSRKDDLINMIVILFQSKNTKSFIDRLKEFYNVPNWFYVGNQQGWSGTKDVTISGHDEWKDIAPIQDGKTFEAK
jgi:hypothetical protein